MQSLLLVNNHVNTIELLVDRAVDISAGTHRRGATRMTPVRVEPGSHTDLVTALGLPKSQALAALECSADYQHWKSKYPGALLVVDVELERAKAAQEFSAKARKDGEKLAELEAEKEKQRLLDVKAAIEAAQLKAAIEAGTVRPPPSKTEIEQAQRSMPTEDEEEGAADAALALESVAASASISDHVPSTKWSREQLAEHAKKKGLDIPDTMSKNAILRKMREG